MKFTFGLEKVLQHRKIQEDVAKRNFMEAAGVVASEERRLNQMVHDLRVAREESFNEQEKGGQKSSHLQYIEEYIVGQKERIGLQEKELERAQQRLEERRAMLVKAGREFKVLEKLKEKRFLDFKKEKTKKENKTLDDITLMQGKRRQRL